MRTAWRLDEAEAPGVLLPPRHVLGGWFFAFVGLATAWSALSHRDDLIAEVGIPGACIVGLAGWWGLRTRSRWGGAVLLIGAWAVVALTGVPAWIDPAGTGGVYRMPFRAFGALVLTILLGASLPGRAAAAGPTGRNERLPGEDRLAESRWLVESTASWRTGPSAPARRRTPTNAATTRTGEEIEGAVLDRARLVIVPIDAGDVLLLRLPRPVGGTRRWAFRRLREPGQDAWDSWAPCEPFPRTPGGKGRIRVGGVRRGNRLLVRLEAPDPPRRLRAWCDVSIRSRTTLVPMSLRFLAQTLGWFGWGFFLFVLAVKGTFEDLGFTLGLAAGLLFFGGITFVFFRCPACRSNVYRGEDGYRWNIPMRCRTCGAPV